MVQFRKDFDIIPQILSHKVLTCQTIPKLRSEALQGWKKVENCLISLTSFTSLILQSELTFQATHLLVSSDK